MQDPNIEFDFSLDPKKLWSVYKEKTNFDSVFQKRIAKDVIKYLWPQPAEVPEQERNILDALEKFVCDLDEGAQSEDVARVFKHLQTLSQPTKLCRRNLKPGDAIFACNDCGLDATCVVCIECFHKSAHKEHNYRILTSEGGGCCDCGDVEAWKQDYACTDHLDLGQVCRNLSDYEDMEARSKLIAKDKEVALEKISRLPKNIASKYFLICQASLHYAHNLLMTKHHSSLSSTLDLNPDDPEVGKLMNTAEESKNYFTVLSNDEVHTYDYVINTLVRFTGCTKMEASIMASTVSREGRCLVFSGNYHSCVQMKDSILSARDTSQGLPLKIDVMHGSILAHQQFAIKLIEWINRMSATCDAFRILTAYTLFGYYNCNNEDSTTGSITLLESIMLEDTFVWKRPRIEFNNLFLSTLLTEYSIKEQFARILTRNYAKLLQYFIEDDHEFSVSVLSMSTQLYTVPSLICMLIEEENALAIVVETLNQTCRGTRRNSSNLSYEDRNTFDMQGLKRGFCVISVLGYLINVKPTKWTNQLRNNVNKATDCFIRLLVSMQGMDSVKRQLGQHLEYEPDWESGMALQSRLVQFITRLVTFCSYDEQVLTHALKQTQTILLEDGFRRVTMELFDHKVECIQYDVSTGVVSVHLPLTRFAAALILELTKLRPCDKIPYDESLILLTEPSKDKLKRSMIAMMEPSLRTQVMIAQFRSGMWRRNGYSLVNQIVYFHGALMRREMFDRDILILQECAAMCDADKFMIHLLNKFNLFTWISSETTRESSAPTSGLSSVNDEDVMVQTMSLGEEFLQLVLTIVGERYCPGVGVVSEEEVVKNEIIHLLCDGPATRSELHQKLCFNDNDGELDCIKTVANLRRTGETSFGKYELKEEFYDRFNPFFYHYSRRQQSNALDAQLKRKKNLRGSLICCPPPKPVELTRQFKNLNAILKCDITLTLIQKILTRALGPQEGLPESSTKQPLRFLASDLQLDQSLHLIGLGLHEQEREPLSFQYMQAAFDKGIFILLKKCHGQDKRSKDLIFWLMKKTIQLVDILKINYSNDCLCDTTKTVIAHVEDCFRDILSTCDPMKQAKKKRNSEQAAQLQNRIMAMMKANQEKFMSDPSTKQLAAETEKNDPKIVEDAEDSGTQPIINGPTSHLCILCRDDQTIAMDQPTMVLLAYVQRSAILSKNRDGRRIPHYALTPSHHLKFRSALSGSLPAIGEQNVYRFTSDNGLSFDATHMPADLFFGPHVSACGHAMHYTCWDAFAHSITKRETSRLNRNTRPVSFELEKEEMLCPLCESISNAVIPLLPNFTKFSDRIIAPGQLGTIFAVDRSVMDETSANLSAFLHALRGAVDIPKPIRHSPYFAKDSKGSSDEKCLHILQPNIFNNVLEELDEKAALNLRDFISSVRGEPISPLTDDRFPMHRNLLISISTLVDRIHIVGLDLDKSITDVHHERKFMMTSWAISYTIQGYERLARFKGLPIFQDMESSKNLCLTSLIRFTCSSIMVFQPDMLQSLLVEKLRFLLINVAHIECSACCLDVDTFEMFVSLFILLQKLYIHEDSPTLRSYATRIYSHEYHRNLLHLMLILNLVQVIISLQTDLAHSSSMDQPSSSSSEPPEPSIDQIVLGNFYKEVILASGHPYSYIPQIDERFVSLIKDRFSPFLRSCAIFFFHLSGIAPPHILRSKSAFHEGKYFSSKPENFKTFDLNASISDLAPSREEYDAICHYLDIPINMSKLLGSQEASHLARSWLRHPRVSLLIASGLKQSRLDPMSEMQPLEPTNTGQSSSISCSKVQLAEEWRLSFTTPPQKATVNQKEPVFPIISNELLPIKLIRQPHLVNRLIDLPHDYSELVDKVSDYSCPSIKNEGSRIPTLCLVCGVMLCSHSYCCRRDLNDLASNYHEISEIQTVNRRSTGTDMSQNIAGRAGHSNTFNESLEFEFLLQNPNAPGPSGAIQQQLVGSCTYHAYECSGGVGVFLRIRSCQILLLCGKSKGCYLPAPYTDDHGETDFGLARGNPLHLSKKHYEKLQLMWLTHAIPEQVSRTLEYSSYASSINWHLH